MLDLIDTWEREQRIRKRRMEEEPKGQEEKQKKEKKEHEPYAWRALLKRKDPPRQSPPCILEESRTTKIYCAKAQSSIPKRLGTSPSLKLQALLFAPMDSKWIDKKSDRQTASNHVTNKHSNVMRITQESPQKPATTKSAAMNSDDSDSDDSLIAYMMSRDKTKERNAKKSSQDHRVGSASDEDSKGDSPSLKCTRKRSRGRMVSQSSSSEDESGRRIHKSNRHKSNKESKRGDSDSLSEDDTEGQIQRHKRQKPRRKLFGHTKAKKMRSTRKNSQDDDSGSEDEQSQVSRNRRKGTNSKYKNVVGRTSSNEEEKPASRRLFTDSSPSPSVKADLDLQLAMSLQQQELDEMDNSDFGKPITAVKKILELLEHTKRKHQHYATNFNAVSRDDMVFLAKNLLETQAKFLRGNIEAYIDIGYHYTNSKNLDSIRTNGLMTKNERDSQGVKSDKFNGSIHGDGVYTGNDPMTFANYGDTGLIVGRLLGSVKNDRQRTGGENALLVRHNGMVVLRTSAQCLPMIKYDKTLVTSEEGKALIIEFQKCLQEILDEVFNPGLTAPKFENVRVRPPGVNRSILRNTRVKGSRMPRRNAQSGTMAKSEPPALQYTAPASISVVHDPDTFCDPPSSYNFQDGCPICHDELQSPQYCFSLKVCNHVFHKGCIVQACKFGSKCPTCRKSIGTPIGKSPSGSMTVSVNTALKCGGYSNCNTITIVYCIPAGTQKPYHENPGQRHKRKLETVYLPNNTEGQNLLKRLKFAFMHGLTFTVGTSMTTGATNQCTWASIHHKTSPNGGVHGFPDPNYFVNCNGELDNLNVPAAHELDASGKKLQN